MIELISGGQSMCDYDGYDDHDEYDEYDDDWEYDCCEEFD